MKTLVLRNLLLALIAVLFTASLAFAKVPSVVLAQKKAVVTIYINDKNGQQVSSGSGFIIDENGIIATNYHVVSVWLETLENILFVKMENGAYFPIEKLIIFDTINDLALFKIDGKELPTVKLATGYKPKQGEDIVVMGSPLGLETTLSSGIISSMRTKSETIQITAPVSPGSSGSPVFNLKGEVIGVVTFLIQGGQNLNFAIPVKQIQNLIMESKKPHKKPVVIPAEEVIVDKETAPASVPLLSPIDELEKAKADVQKNQDNPQSYLNLGIAYFKLGKHQEAIEAYKQALRIKPDFAYAYYDLGVAYTELGRYQESLEALKQAIRIKPDSADAHYNLAATYSDLGRYQESLEALKQAIRIKPDSADAHSGLGYTYRRLGMFKECIEASKQAIRIKPDHADAHLNLGLASIALGDRGSALEEYKILRELDPQQAEKLFNLIYK